MFPLLARGLEVVHRDFHQRDDRLPFHSRLPREFLVGRAQHVDVHVRHRVEAAALDQNRLLVQAPPTAATPPSDAEHRCVAQAELHQPQAHHAVIDMPERDARELDHVDLDASGGKVVEQRLNQPLRLVVEEKGAVEQVYAHDAERLLLQRVFGVEHPHVDDDLAVLVARMGLEPHAHPAVTFVGAFEIARRNRIGEDEKRGRVAARLAQPADVEIVLVVQHASSRGRQHSARNGRRWRR